MKEIIELLKDRKLTKPEPILKKIMSYDPPALIELGFEIQKTLLQHDKTSGPQSNGGGFRFVASGALSGHSGCVSPLCRIKKSVSLARYAALYSDLVIVPWRLEVPENLRLLEDFRESLITAILSVIAMRPVIEAGLVTLIPSRFHFCDDCARLAYREMDRVREAVEAALTSNFGKFSARPQDARSIHLEGPQEYLEHGEVYVHYPRRPAWLPARSKAALSRAQLKKSGAVAGIFEQMATSVIFQQLCAVNMKTKLLTSLAGEAEILAKLAPQDEVSTGVARLCAALSHEIPLLSGVPLSRMVELRQEQPAAFDQYRTALSGVLAEYVEKQKPLGSISAKRVYDERIHPEVVALRRRIETHKKALLKKSVTSAVVASALVAVGIAAKLTPAELGVLGTGSLVTSLTGLLGDASEEPKDVKNHQLYFLVKLSE
ncbi:MAG TPA: hypothetical protein VJ731_10145 [Terriglobales bacterium]|nr:hypothetical protein [Terriglobales bacterium]